MTTKFKTNRYTEEAKKLLGTKTNPEPWLHIQLVGDSSTKHDDIYYAIYVWDTRQVIESGVVNCKNSGEFTRISMAFRGMDSFMKIPFAKDKRKAIVGSGNVVKRVNKEWNDEKTQAYFESEDFKKRVKRMAVKGELETYLHAFYNSDTKLKKFAKQASIKVIGDSRFEIVNNFVKQLNER
jgi:hypothetical protein